MRSHPYRLIGERLGSSLRQVLEPVISDWAEDWLPDNTSYSLKKLIPLFEYCQEKESAEIEQMVNWVDDNWSGLLSPVRKGLLGSILVGVMDGDLHEMASSRLLRDIAQQALTDLAQRLLAGNQATYDSVPFFVTDNQFPKGAMLRGSGAIVIKLNIGGLYVHYVISPMTVERYLKTLGNPDQELRQKLTPLQTALANQELSARVSLGSATLSLGELATIRIGDVVTLDKHINEPASMRLGKNGDVCEGFIGVKGKSMAFRISQAKKQHSE
ncbi:MAG: FliM/FliN family flagellar motor switch protein [Candidatus Thiodiazotropha endolucinida]